MKEQPETKTASYKEDPCECPVGQFISFLERSLGITSEFKKHIYNSKVELLKAIRSMIDKKIEDLESRVNAPDRQAERIEIE